MSAFTDAMAFNWRPEFDGQGPHVTPKDPGGATSWGMTYGTWKAWQAIHGQPADLTIFMHATRESFLPIFQAWFWNAMQADNLPIGVSLSVFDDAIVAGAHSAAVRLQAVVQVRQDGMVGPLTINACRKMPAGATIAGLAAARHRYYDNLPNAPTFARGWDHRIDTCCELSQQLCETANARACFP